MCFKDTDCFMQKDPMVVMSQGSACRAVVLSDNANVIFTFHFEGKYISVKSTCLKVVTTCEEIEEVKCHEEKPCFSERQHW